MRRFIALFITLLILSCSKDSDTYSLKGNAYGFADGTTIYVYTIEDNNQPQPIDTLTVQKEQFSATYPKSDRLMLGYLVTEEPRGNVVFFPENENLTVHMYKDSLSASYVSGSKQNEMYTGFMKTIRELNRKKQSISSRYQAARNQQDGILMSQIQQENIEVIAEETNYKLGFIKENTSSIFSLMLLSEMLSRQEILPSQASEVLNTLPPKLAASQLGTQLKATIENLKRAEIGSLAPDFSAPSPSGDMLSLKESMGKYTIVDFWASWCKPCRAENPNVVRVYQKYHDKGLNIISVSLDREGQKDRWLKAIEDDKMTWAHVSNLKFWQDPIAKMYNVRSIPATFLLDENGTIIDKNLRGQALEAKIASLLGQ